MVRIVLATCQRWPAVSPSDGLYAAALRERGTDVAGAPWNGPAAAFAGVDLIVLRSTWDYHEMPAQFCAWLAACERAGTRVLNPPPLVLWNMDKHYLADLAARGVPVPHTDYLPWDAHQAAALAQTSGPDPVVVKPVIGASGHAVTLLPRAALSDHFAQPQPFDPPRMMMVQEFLPELQTTGELSLIFFDGVFSHAAIKRPAPGDFRVNTQYRGTYTRCDPDPSLVAHGRAVLVALDVTPLYARVDGVVRDGRFILMELEVHEPGLMLDLDPAAAGRFAEATLRRLPHV